jgi:hypothetical protein
MQKAIVDPLHNRFRNQTNYISSLDPAKSGATFSQLGYFFFVLIDKTDDRAAAESQLLYQFINSEVPFQRASLPNVG